MHNNNDKYILLDILVCSIGWIFLLAFLFCLALRAQQNTADLKNIQLYTKMSKNIYLSLLLLLCIGNSYSCCEYIKILMTFETRAIFLLIYEELDNNKCNLYQYLF